MLNNLKNWRWWGHRLMELTAATALFYMSVALIEYRDAMKRANVPPEAWFELHEIFVPDHVVGSNPEMIYDRTIHVNHRGFWVSEAQRVNPDGRFGVFETACTGTGVNDYDVTDVLGENNGVTWMWFFDRKCEVPPGQYRIQLTRDMRVPDYPVKQGRNWSNTFTVLPRPE